MDSGEDQNGYWKSMPSQLRTRFVVWSIYGLIALWLATIHMYLAVALIALPIVIWLALIWFFEGLLCIGVGNGLLVYTVDYLWKSSFYTRAFMMVAVVAAALGALGWFGTEQMRQEAAQPSLTERVSGTASGIVVATSDKVDDATSATKGWVDRAKGWFVSEEPASE